VKAKGAKWDIDLKRWCIAPGMSMKEFIKWVPLSVKQLLQPPTPSPTPPPSQPSPKKAPAGIIIILITTDYNITLHYLHRKERKENK